MKQRLFQNMLKAAGAFLFAVTMSAGFTACQTRGRFCDHLEQLA